MVKRKLYRGVNPCLLLLFLRFLDPGDTGPVQERKEKAAAAQPQAEFLETYPPHPIPWILLREGGE